MSIDVTRWPALPLGEWQDTYATLHRWMQIVGKIRLSRMPWSNHSWHVVLYVTAQGLTTSPIHYGSRTFEIDFDFIDYQLSIRDCDGGERKLPLRAQPVADFHRALLGELDALGLGVAIHGRPNEVEDAIPFAEDRVHASYDPEYANRWWRILVQADRVFSQFRARFIGRPER